MNCRLGNRDISKRDNDFSNVLRRIRRIRRINNCRFLAKTEEKLSSALNRPEPAYSASEMGISRPGELPLACRARAKSTYMSLRYKSVAYHPEGIDGFL